MAQRISLESLRYVAAVADTGSFSEAARFHSISQPALSTAIARLEETLGDRLFDRSTRGVTPTAFGAQVIPLVDSVLKQVDALTAEARRLALPARETIHLGVSPLISPVLVAAAFGTVRALPASAERELVLREANMSELLAALQAAELDLVLIPSVGPIPLFAHRIVEEEPIVVLDAGSASRGPVDLGDLLGARLILVSDACGLTRFTHQLFESRNRTPSTYPGEASSYRVLEDWARLGLGTALLPLSKLTSAEVDHRVLVDEGVEVTIFYEAVWDPRSPLAADLAALAEAIATQR